MQQMFIVPARPEDAPTAAAILEGAVAAGDAPLWNPDEITAAALMPAILSEELHLVWSGPEIAGTFILEWEDQSCWPEKDAGDAAYIHKIASRNGQTAMVPSVVQWSGERARNRGRQYLRTSCDALDTRMRVAIETAGFTYHSDVRLGARALARFEMPLLFS